MMRATKLMMMTLGFGIAGSLALAQPQTQTATGTAGTLTDGQIMHILKTADEGEVDLGKLAKSRAQNKDVKEFAKQMVDEHKKNEKEGKDIAKKTKVEMTKNDTSTSLEKMVDTEESNLKKLKGADFDKAYIGNQITMHKQLLDDLNQKLIPAAQSPELKTHLENTKSHVEKHLTRAQQIQDSLTK